MSRHLISNLNKQAPAIDFRGFLKIIRSHSSARGLHISPDQIDDARKRAKEICKEFAEHPVMQMNHPFFQFLRDEAKKGFTPAQMSVYLQNYAFRTRGTVLMGSQFVSQSIKYGHFKQASIVAQNLYEEMGSGNHQDVHLLLLDTLLQTVGEKVYGLPKFNTFAPDPAQILPAATEFRAKQNKAIANSGNFFRLLGRLIAHEMAADGMLNTFRATLYDPIAGYLTPEEHAESSKYYDVHRDDSKEGGDIEARHARDAEEAAAEIIAQNPRRAPPQIKSGGLEILDCQNDLWNEMHEEMDLKGTVGVRIPPKFRVEEKASSEKPVQPKKSEIRNEGKPKTAPQPVGSKLVSAEDVKLILPPH